MTPGVLAQLFSFILKDDLGSSWLLSNLGQCTCFKINFEV